MDVAGGWALQAEQMCTARSVCAHRRCAQCVLAPRVLHVAPRAVCARNVRTVCAPCAHTPRALRAHTVRARIARNVRTHCAENKPTNLELNQPILKISPPILKISQPILKTRTVCGGRVRAEPRASGAHVQCARHTSVLLAVPVPRHI